MATFKFEALDTAGTEVKDSVQALSEEEAQQKIMEMSSAYILSRAIHYLCNIYELVQKEK